jgi:trehalose 6-phosphate phosphatase
LERSVPFDELDLRDFALLLDVDGTLLDIAPTPHTVHVPESLLKTLVRIGERTKGACALVSGRPIADLDLIFTPLRLPAVGGHGAEIRPDPKQDALAHRAVPLDRTLKLRLMEVANRYEGVATEDKGYSLALHYRLALERGLNVVDDVFQVCKAYPPDSYELLSGKAVIEVKSVGFNKGTAVRELMTYPPFAGRAPIFIGDDTTDEAAFEVVPEFKGLAISVGRKVPGVDAVFDTPADVRRWLERVAEYEAVAP